MTADRDQWDLKPPAPALLLLVKRPDHEPEEYYVEEGMTIGRSLANTIVIAGDEHVARFHARVELNAARQYSMVAVSHQNRLAVNREEVGEVVLDVGVRFQVGAARCVCLAVPQLGKKPPLLEDCGNPLQDRSAARTGWDGPRLAIPSHLGCAQTQRVLHADETGIGLLGLDQATSQPVRIEWLTRMASADPQKADFVLQLARLRCSVRHQNLITLREVGVADNSPFLIWDWVDRVSLGNIIADYGELGSLAHFADVVPWIRQIGSALGTLEQHGMVAELLDKTRMLMDHRQQIVVVDCLLRWPFSHLPNDERLVGSAGPGGHWGRCNGGRTDVAASHLQFLGQLLHELLTTRPLFGSAKTASAFNPTVPPQMDRFIARCLRGNAQRYADTPSAMADFEVLVRGISGNHRLDAPGSSIAALIEAELGDDPK